MIENGTIKANDVRSQPRRSVNLSQDHQFHSFLFVLTLKRAVRGILRSFWIRLEFGQLKASIGYSEALTSGAMKHVNE